MIVSHVVILRRLNQCKNAAGTLLNVSWKSRGKLLSWICRHPDIARGEFGIEIIVIVQRKLKAGRAAFRTVRVTAWLAKRLTANAVERRRIEIALGLCENHR